MNRHKEKCSRLKKIRKELADGLGIDLNQRECTFEGECRGTCPKCRQEEEKLNRALLGRAAAVAVSTGLLMTGCQSGTPAEGATTLPEGSQAIWGESSGAKTESEDTVPPLQTEGEMVCPEGPEAMWEEFPGVNTESDEIAGFLELEGDVAFPEEPAGE